MEKAIAKQLRSLVGSPITYTKWNARIPDVGPVDLLMKDKEGRRYLVEIKHRRITSFDIGQLVRYSNILRKTMPSAKLVFVYDKASPAQKEDVSRLNILQVELEKKLLNLSPPSESTSLQAMHAGGTIGLSPKEQDVYFMLLREGIWIITAVRLSKLLDIQRQYSKNILANLAKRGVITRIGRGKYAVVSPDIIYQRKEYTVDPLVILDEFMGKAQYYVAYQSAAYMHGMAHQLPFTTTVAVHKQRRSLQIGNSLVRFVTIKKALMLGFERQKYLDSYVNVSDLEKTIIDCIHRHDLCGGIEEVTRSISEILPKIDGDRLIAYLRMANNYALTQRLGFILDKLLSKGFKVDTYTIDDIEKLKGRHVYALDFTKARKGKKSRKWNIIENTNCLGWEYA